MLSDQARTLAYLNAIAYNSEALKNKVYIAGGEEYIFHKALKEGIIAIYYLRKSQCFPFNVEYSNMGTTVYLTSCGSKGDKLQMNYTKRYR